VPFCMGAIAGGIASGQVPSGGRAGDPVHSWLNPTSLVTGVLAVAVAAYVAAVYLVWDARRSGKTAMVEYFRRRAVLAAVVAAVLSVIGLVIVHDEAPHVFDGLTSRALPVVLLSVVCGAGALVLLVRDATRGARVLALTALAVAVVAALLIVLPGFVLLFVLVQRHLLPEEGVDDVGDRPLAG
jgi:cytochrome bd ubiquinol oxidase subunit II